MEKFTNIHSSAVPLPQENIDTDQIIPARFLKAITREGFGENLFRDWRFDREGKEKDFVLNDATYSGKVLVAGKNFGCGSSREHAAWAIYDYGFRVVISSFFADIFKNNALNNGLLVIQTSEEQLQQLMDIIQEDPDTTFDVNLEEQTVVNEAKGISFTFDINSFKKLCLLNGYDNVDFLRSKTDEIKAYEASYQK
ncbi:MAG: 3-isopropylmalate dehydratase small subunit [Bacteroidota bacterium]